MKRVLEWIFGLDRQFLDQEGDLSIQFHPRWPGQEGLDQFFTKIGFGPIGAEIWNVLLITLIVLLVVYVYKREGRSRGPRIALAGIRLCILGFVLALLNLPVFTIGQSRTEPSVLAVLVDDSISMRVKDVTPGGQATPGVEPVSRMEAIVQALKAEDQALVKNLAKTHILRFYRFNRQAVPLVSLTSDSPTTAPSSEQPKEEYAPVLAALEQLKPLGENT